MRMEITVKQRYTLLLFQKLPKNNANSISYYICRETIGPPLKLKHSRTSPDVQFKEFSLTKQKTRPREDYEWIGKTIYKKILSKKSKKQ